MKKIIIFCCTLICACNSNTIYKQPENLIPKDTMVMLLTDLYISSAAKNVKTIYNTKNESYVPLIYEKYCIDSTRFYNSNNFYTSKIEEYQELLEEVKQNILVKHDSFKRILDVKDSIERNEKKKKKLEKKRKDSIKKVNAKRRLDSINGLKKRN